MVSSINTKMKLFRNSKYTSIYWRIIENARSRELSNYEVHHIVPRCMGGTDDSSNLIKLTCREHFICHKILAKITTGDHQRRLQHAFSYMVFTNEIRPTLRITSHDYELARKYAKNKRCKEWSQNISKALKGRRPSPESISKMSAALTGRELTSAHRENIRKAVLGRKHQKSSIKKCADAKSKKFIIYFPDGSKEIVVGLKQWCKSRNYNYHTLHNNSKLEGPINRGELKGFNCISAS